MFHVKHWGYSGGYGGEIGNLRPLPLFLTLFNSEQMSP